MPNLIIPKAQLSRFVHLLSGSFTVQNTIVPTLHALGRTGVIVRVSKLLEPTPIALEMAIADIPTDDVVIVAGWDDLTAAMKKHLLDILKDPGLAQDIIVTHRLYLS